MKSIIKSYLKSSRVLYLLYYYLGSFALRTVGLFIKTRPNQVLFISYGGQKYDDSPRVVYEYLQNNEDYSELECVWAFSNPQQYPEVKNKVKTDTLSYFVKAMQSGYWITNSSATRGLNFKKKDTKNYFFTHGMTAIKKIGNDIEQTKGTFRRNFVEPKDAIFIEGNYEVDILEHAWNYPRECYVNVGLPRNDDLVSVSEEEIISLRERLCIPEGKKVILYTPTFREQSRDKSDRSNVLGIPFDFEKWKKELGDHYVMLITAHYEVAKLLGNLPQDGFVINGFKYPVLNDLLKVADIMITDYSSVAFDYSILERPIFCYGYDYEEYTRERGVYTDLNTLFLHGVQHTEDEIIESIKVMDYQAECIYTRNNIKEKYLAHYDGKSAENAARVIFGDRKNGQ